MRVSWSACRLVILGVVVATTAACTGGEIDPGETMTVTASPTVLSAQSLTSQLLSGTFVVPSGFTVGATNPLIPADVAPYGAVSSSVTSPSGATYDVEFSPVVIPCGYAACTSAKITLVVGNASPAQTQTSLVPDVGVPAQCGYDGDNAEVGCDAIIGPEYVAVRASGPGTSTADAVAVLRAAVEYASKSGA